MESSFVTDHASSELEKEIIRNKCEKFVQWVTDVGIKCPKLEYPGFFDGGLVGVKVKAPIAHREAFLFVPQNVIISLDKCYNHQELGPIFELYPDLFSEENHDYEQLTLTVFLMFQKQLGSYSFWKPYIDLLPDVTFFCDLPFDTIYATNDAFMMSELKIYKQELDSQYKQLYDCLSKHPEVFKTETLDRKNFMSLYSQVCTRCFGWELPHTSLIPMADNFNHSDVNVTFEMITKSLQIQGDEKSSYFSKAKFMNDYSLVFNKQEIGNSNEVLLNVYGRFSKQQFQKNVDIENTDSIYKQMLEKQIWQVDTNKDRYFEDNDTESEGDEIEFYKIEQALDKGNRAFVAFDEKRMPQNIYPSWIRKNREYIQVHDNPPPLYEGEEQFEWYSQELHEPESYFAMINTQRRELQKGEQVFYCYGHRTNKYLLVNYGFCFANNCYDSFMFNLSLKLPQLVIPCMVLMKPQNVPVQEIRLKNDQINEMMMFYLRCHLKSSNIQWQEFELLCLTWYENIIEYLQQQLQFETTLEQDLETLRTQDLSWGMKMAFVYRTERLKILASQRIVVKMMKYVVQYSKEAAKDSVFKELILRQTDEESELEKNSDKDKFKEQYQHRRLINSSYFQYVYYKVTE